MKKSQLQQRLLTLSFVNLLLVALLGVLLRTFPFLSSFPFAYKNVLHGHSHFAFSGWVMLVLFALLMKAFPAIKERIPYRHWRNVAALIVLSTYGMLVAFPFQGYKVISISFSTLAIVATVYLTIIIRKALASLPKTVPHRFVQWGLFYACLSSIGPFAIGPLIAMGKSGSPLYFDAIYFYLHFQYNGFFTFLVLAFLYRMLEKRCEAVHGRKVLLLLNTALIPAYALSVLWHQPSVVFNWLGGSAALLQLGAVIFLLLDAVKVKFKNSVLLSLSLTAFVLKSLLQFFSAFPVIAQLAYEYRNLVIAYLHLVLLGFVSLFVFASVLKRNPSTQLGIALFLFSFLSTESLLVLQVIGSVYLFSIPSYLEIILACSVFFPVGVALMLSGLRSQNKASGKKESQKQNELYTILD
ncbi:MAG TPA: hypothetical protein VGN63_18430 [Flavisolibacter sp.]|nr:hypothetical protein [Flavisolibacter sp.]